VPFSIEGNCRNQTAAIQAAVTAACAALGTTITDQALRGCIQERCDGATIECEDCKTRNLLGYNNQISFFGLFTIWKSSTVHICVNNVRHANKGDIVIHEWAHSCCWDHGDGQGVPGDNGTLPN
jgi:hypothetical protein